MLIMTRLVFLNALPLNAFNLREGNEVVFRVKKISLDDLKSIVRNAEGIDCFIRHKATVEFLRNVLGIDIESSSSLYSYNPNDRIVVIALKKPIRGQEVSVVRLEDIEVYLVDVVERR